MKITALIRNSGGQALVGAKVQLIMPRNRVAHRVVAEGVTDEVGRFEAETDRTINGSAFALLVNGKPVLGLTAQLSREALYLGQIVYSETPLAEPAWFHCGRGNKALHGLPEALLSLGADEAHQRRVEQLQLALERSREEVATLHEVRAHALAAERSVDEMRARLEEANSRIEETEVLAAEEAPAEIDMDSDELQRAVEAEQRAQAAEKRLGELEARAEEAEARAEEMEGFATKLQGRVEEAEAKAADLEERCDRGDELISSLEFQLEDARVGHQQEAEGLSAKLQEELETTQARSLEALAALKERHAAALEAAKAAVDEAANERVTELQGQIQTLEAEIAAERSEHALELEVQRERMGTLRDTSQEAQAALRAQLDEAVARADKAQAQLEGARAELANALEDALSREAAATALAAGKQEVEDRLNEVEVNAQLELAELEERTLGETAEALERLVELEDAVTTARANEAMALQELDQVRGRVEAMENALREATVRAETAELSAQAVDRPVGAYLGEVEPVTESASPRVRALSQVLEETNAELNRTHVNGGRYVPGAVRLTLKGLAVDTGSNGVGFALLTDKELEEIDAHLLSSVEVEFQAGDA